MTRESSLDVRELQKVATAADAARIFAAADTTGDGVLSLQELNAYAAAHPLELAAVTEQGQPRWEDLVLLMKHD